MKEIDLAEAIAFSMEQMTQRVCDHYDKDDFDDATAIIEEWTLPSTDCVLTKYITGDTSTIPDEMIYFSSTEYDITYGTFSFDTPELPVDNN